MSSDRAPRVFALSASLTAPAGVIGAKAAGLTTMMRLGLPVPAGFVISTAVCREFLAGGGLPGEMSGFLRGLTRVSVRSGAAVSMPGMMNTVLDVAPAAVASAVAEVFASWRTPRAVTYRELHAIPHDLGTAVIVQQMIHGDRDERSGSGVAFSRDPGTGEKRLFGEVVFAQRGDAVVSGTSPTQPLAALATREPVVWQQLAAALELLERHYRDVCHVEFTYESGRLWFLQVRPGGLVGRAAVRAAVDLVAEGLISRRTALTRITPRDLSLARVPRIRAVPPEPADLLARGQGAGPGVLVARGQGAGPGLPVARGQGAGPGVPVARGQGAGPGLPVARRQRAGPGVLLARGQGASPGVAVGHLAVTADAAARMAASGPVVLVRPHTSPLDMHGLAAAAGIVTTLGGPTSHAAVVARSMAKPAVVGATALTVDVHDQQIRAGGRVLPEGTVITLDGTGGEVVLGDPGIVTATDDPHLTQFLAWTDQSPPHTRPE